MPDRSLSQSLGFLSEPERLKRYRQFAEEALEKAKEAGEADLRAGFLTMAAGWHSLACEIERATHPGEPQDAGTKAH